MPRPQLGLCGATHTGRGLGAGTPSAHGSDTAGWGGGPEGSPGDDMQASASLLTCGRPVPRWKPARPAEAASWPRKAADVIGTRSDSHRPGHRPAQQAVSQRPAHSLLMPTIFSFPRGPVTLKHRWSRWHAALRTPPWILAAQGVCSPARDSLPRRDKRL